MQVDGSGLAWVAGSNGTAAYDASDPVRPRLVKRTDWHGYPGSAWNDYIHHSSLRLGRGVLAVTEESFGPGCVGAGTLQTWRISRRRHITPLDSFAVERDRSARLICSAHYFDARDGLIAQGFYEQGVRLIDARRPGRLRQVGYYLNRPGLFWGALFAPTDPTGSTVYALDHSRGIDVLALQRGRLRTVRRRGAWPPVGARAPVDPNFSLEITDGFDTLAPGAPVRLTVTAEGGIGPADVQLSLPAELIDVRAPPGFAYDPSSRTLRASLPAVGYLSWQVEALVAPSARPGTQLETIGYISGVGDPLLLDDRGVDQSIVGRRGRRGAVASITSPRPVCFCRLP